MFSALWRRWLITARKIGYVQSWLILALIYFLVLAPFALGGALLTTTRRIRRRASRAIVRRRRGR